MKKGIVKILEKLDIDDMEAAAYLAGWLAVKFINK